jgi:3-hydroxyisobutyrate dehydrogenase
MTGEAGAMTDRGNPPGCAVAVVGLGQMGRGIARNLDRAGLLVAAHDSDPDAFGAAGFSPAVADPGLADLLVRADVVLFVVPSTAEVAACLDGHGRPGQGQVVVDLTTSDPAASTALAADLAGRGIGFLDAAMTGGAAGADAGTLTLMVGGSEADLDRARPALEAVAARLFHMGPAGTGHAMKLVHNMILHATFLATCEGLRIAERAGLDPSKAVEVLNAGNARSFVSEVRFPRDILSGTFSARSKVSNLAKDLRMAVDQAERLGMPAPFGAMTRDLLDHAEREGMASEDFARLYPGFERLAVDLDRERRAR